MNDQEINEAVARKLGWKLFDEHYSYWIPPTIEAVHKYGDRPSHLPLYTKKIEAAWEIVEFLAKKNLTVDLTFEIYIKPRARVSIRSDGGGGTWHINVKCVQNESAPMAICLAFLKLEDKNG